MSYEAEKKCRKRVNKKELHIISVLEQIETLTLALIYPLMQWQCSAQITVEKQYHMHWWICTAKRQKMRGKLSAVRSTHNAEFSCQLFFEHTWILIPASSAFPNSSSTRSMSSCNCSYQHFENITIVNFRRMGTRNWLEHVPYKSFQQNIADLLQESP